MEFGGANGVRETTVTMSISIWAYGYATGQLAIFTEQDYIMILLTVSLRKYSNTILLFELGHE